MSTTKDQESAVTEKVGELMLTIDQVKKYRALSKLVLDFGIIVLGAISLLLVLELIVNLYRLTTGFPCYYILPSTFICQAGAGGLLSPIVQLMAGISVLLFPCAGILTGVFWVDRKLHSIQGGSWIEPLKEGFPGAMRLLEALDWDSVFADMRISKLAYFVYFLIKVLGYWILASVILVFPYSIGLSLLHASPNLYVLGVISLVLVLTLTRHDLSRRFQQIGSLDTILWELRWFSNELRRTELSAQ